MKKLILIGLLLCGFVYLGSCTNDEGNADLDVITPIDSVVSQTDIKY